MLMIMVMNTAAARAVVTDMFRTASIFGERRMIAFRLLLICG